MGRRLASTLPDKWFADDAVILPRLLGGMGAAWAAVFDLIAAVQRQTRVLTVDGEFLDLAAADFRSARFQRRDGESDALFRARLLPIFREKVTRASLVARLVAVTDNVPQVFEPMRPADTGGYGVAMGYGVAGRYGSALMHNEMLIQVARPAGQGIPLVAGYGTPAGGYGVGRAVYAGLADAAPHVTDADIYEAVADTIPAGAIAWVSLTGNITGGLAPIGQFQVGVNAIL